MSPDFTTSTVFDLLLRFGIDVVAMAILVFGMFYQRYRDKEMVITAGLFNVFIFAVLTILSSVQFGIAAGFGLFAILALFTLRSEQISKTEITYFFGSVSIAVICSIQGSTYGLVVLMVLFILIGTYIIDHPKVLQSEHRVKVTLDEIDPTLLSTPEKMRAELSRRLGAEVMSFQVINLDYTSNVVRVTVHYRDR